MLYHQTTFYAMPPLLRYFILYFRFRERAAVCYMPLRLSIDAFSRLRHYFRFTPFTPCRHFFASPFVSSSLIRHCRHAASARRHNNEMTGINTA